MNSESNHAGKISPHSLVGQTISVCELLKSEALFPEPEVWAAYNSKSEKWCSWFVLLLPPPAEGDRERPTSRGMGGCKRWFYLRIWMLLICLCLHLCKTSRGVRLHQSGMRPLSALRLLDVSGAQLSAAVCVKVPLGVRQVFYSIEAIWVITSKYSVIWMFWGFF